MVRAAGINERGVKYKAGLLYPMAHKSLSMITAEDMTHAHESRKLKSKRQADYAMQGLRAVMNWHGVVVALSPLAKTTAGKNRIVIPISKKNPQPIPNEFLGAWWEAATQESVDAERRSSRAGADGLRLMILTGMRPGEIFGNEFKQGLCVKDVSLVTGRLIAVDTKNHLDHTVLLPKYAVEILEKNCVGKKPEDKVFDIVNFYKVIQRINEQASVKISPHKLRHTFSSIAAASPLISEVTLKCMINHISGSGATGYYTASVASDLTKGWQAVENCILEAAKQYRKTKLRRVA
jgi:integrase